MIHPIITTYDVSKTIVRGSAEFDIETGGVLIGTFGDTITIVAAGKPGDLLPASSGKTERVEHGVRAGAEPLGPDAIERIPRTLVSAQGPVHLGGGGA